MARQSRTGWGSTSALLCILLGAACGGPAPGGLGGATGAPSQVGAAPGGLLGGRITEEQVLRGRQLVITHGCGGCHGGTLDPRSDQWLTGNSADTIPAGGFRAWPRNLTPDDETGLGRVSERQIFNALRFGLRPSATPDVTITSSVPGQGNHPASPDYLSPVMPWLYWRYMSDQELWDIVAYLKHGITAVRKKVPESEAPPDRWARHFAPDRIGTHVLPPFPTNQEELQQPERREEVVRGRRLVADHACGDCHGGGRPDREGWLAGIRHEEPGADESCDFCFAFQIGPFKTRPRNLTPDNRTGIGRFSERQLFNALRYGLRPGETADVEITSSTPGEGNHPTNPKYLAPPMPWPDWRHMTDQQLRDIAAYLKHGLKPVRNQVEDSEGPPDFWASEYAKERYGTYPAPPFPTARERRPS